MTTSGTTPRPGISQKITRTLDPCVVLMKEMVGQYADEWKDRGGIFSLAQGKYLKANQGKSQHRFDVT